MSKRKIICPICMGSGTLTIEEQYFKKSSDSLIAHNLQKEGYTIRQIMRIMGYEHPGSISHLLKTQ